MTVECDVLVLGGGPAGLAAAIDLRSSAGLDAVVVESREAPAERFGESLPPDIVVLLNRLGLSEAFRDDGHVECPGSVSVWGRAKPGHNDFILNPIGPAWHIDRPRFEAMLAARAAAVGVSTWAGWRAVTARRVDRGFVVHVQQRTATDVRQGARSPRERSVGRREVRAGWVVDATGSRAWFAHGQGVRRTSQDRSVAIVRLATISGGGFTSQTVVEATREGWWYCARLPGDRLVTVLVTAPGEARSLARASYSRWRELLAATVLVAPRLAGCRVSGERLRPYPVVSSRLDRVDGDRWLAVGDAASVWDPIVSQGIYKALLDAADAGQTIAGAVGRGPLPGWSYSDRVNARFEAYAADRARLYGLEQRWRDAPFWNARA